MNGKAVAVKLLRNGAECPQQYQNARREAHTLVALQGCQFVVELIRWDEVTVHRGADSIPDDVGIIALVMPLHQGVLRGHNLQTQLQGCASAVTTDCHIQPLQAMRIRSHARALNTPVALAG